MDRHQQKPQALQIPEVDVEEVLDLQRSEIELLREQVTSLNLELYHKNQLLLEVEQELQYTNEELCVALQPECVTCDAAKQSAKEILAENLPTREALAELLITVYGVVINPWELGQRVIGSQLCSRPRAKLDRHSAKHLELNTQFQVLRSHYETLKSQHEKRPV